LTGWGNRLESSTGQSEVKLIILFWLGQNWQIGKNDVFAISRGFAVVCVQATDVSD
jgi:hypothetical protein